MLQSLREQERRACPSSHQLELLCFPGGEMGRAQSAFVNMTCHRGDLDLSVPLAVQASLRGGTSLRILEDSVYSIFFSRV